MARKKIIKEQIELRRRYKSRSSLKKFYQTIKDHDGNITCNCPGWIYHRKCWHTDKVYQLVQLIDDWSFITPFVS